MSFKVFLALWYLWWIYPLLTIKLKFVTIQNPSKTSEGLIAKIKMLYCIFNNSNKLQINFLLIFLKHASARTHASTTLSLSKNTCAYISDYNIYLEIINSS